MQHRLLTLLLVLPLFAFITGGRAAAQGVEQDTSSDAPATDPRQDDAAVSDAAVSDAARSDAAPSDAAPSDAANTTSAEMPGTEPASGVLVAQPFDANANRAGADVDNQQALQHEEEVEVEAEVEVAPFEEPRRLVLGTTMGGLAGIIGGFGLSWGPSFGVAAVGCDDGGSECVDLAVFPMFVTTWGTPLTTAVGIWLGGRAAGGRGHFGHALLGSMIGGVLGGGLAGLGVFAQVSQGFSIVSVLMVPVLEWAGGLIGYHLSHKAKAARARARDDLRPTALPTLSLMPGGASLGLAGTF